MSIIEIFNASEVRLTGVSKKAAIVTGASKVLGLDCDGIGSGGRRVAVTYSSDRQGAERVAQAIIDSGGKVITVASDVSKAAEVAPCFGRLHCSH